SHFSADAIAREMVWWGRSLDEDRRAELASRVSAAISRANALGFPTRARLLRDMRLDSGRPLAASKSGRGLLAILSMIEQAADAGTLAGRMLVSAHIHHDLERWNLYGELFRDAGTIAVSCHEILPHILRSRFGAICTKHILIPPGDAMRE